MTETEILKERLEQQEERTRDYATASSIITNALIYGEPISNEDLEVLEYIIYVERSGRLCECEDCGCLFTPYED